MTLLIVLRRSRAASTVLPEENLLVKAASNVVMLDNVSGLVCAWYQVAMVEPTSALSMIAAMAPSSENRFPKLD